MRRLLMVLAVCLTLAGGPVSAQDDLRPIHEYSFWHAHREDAGDLSGWTSVYTFTHETCGSAVIAVMIQAYNDGWDTDDLDAQYSSIVLAFPGHDILDPPCSATLALR